TLPPVIMPFDPTGTVPVCLVALNSPKESEQVLYDVARYDVRPMIMSNPGAVAPVVFGGTIRTVMIYLDRIKMQARHLAPTDVMKATDDFNVFLPNGSIKLGDYDYAVASNSLFDYVEQMGDIPLRNQVDNAAFLRDVANPQDSAFIQTNVVRVNGRRQVYVPVYRQGGASTLSVVNTLREHLGEIQGRLSKSDIDLQIVMDQSVYVRNSIVALVQEGVLGALLCSLVILLFLGQWRMTLIAVMTIPLAVVAAVICLYATGQTINVMTLAGLALAIGPLVDSAIICLENTHRHLGMGAEPREAAFLGASEVAMPELVSTLCTFLVLTPLILVPGMGRFLFQPMAMGVAFAMIAAYFLSRTLVPSYSGLFLRAHDADAHGTRNPFSRAFARWEALIDRGIAWYVRGLNWALRNRWLTVAIGFGFLALTIALIGPRLRREFFPEVDAGAFEIAVRAPTGIRIERTEERVAQVEKFIHQTIPEHDLQLVVSELGLTPDWSAAYTPNAGPMDAVVRVQLREHRSHSAQEYVDMLREGLAASHKFPDLQFSFDAGGMVRGALNEGKSSPLTVRVVGKNARVCYQIADSVKREITGINGVVDARIIQRMDYPQFVINVDRKKTAVLGLTQADVMRNVVAACNSSVSYNKTNFWIDPASHNQYFVGVQYPEDDIKSIDTLLDIPVTGAKQLKPVPLRSVATITRTTVPSEIAHYNIQPTIELTMNIQGRSLGEVSDDVALLLDRHGRRNADGSWAPYDPKFEKAKTIVGSKIVLSGEYARMQETFRNLSLGLVLASLLMYCLMVGLDRSWIVPLTVMLVVPVSLGGVLVMLYFTGTALNVQSLLGIIFVVGIKVANTVLMTDFAQELRRHEGLSPLEAIRKAAAIRVRPVTMTALAAFFAMIPAAIAFERGSEANAPLARAILGGLLAGEPATLFLLPALFAILVRDKPQPDARGHAGPEMPSEPVPAIG
ncbi:MAG TPA: efflux RND transporter permease subunit, partial [Pirellulales bacterium]|nr:efflux RND transporter permease subunit [Pirellulales bacterium]